MDMKFTSSLSSLRLHRLTAGMKQCELGRIVSRSQPFLSRLETGSGYAKVDAELAAKIGEALGVDPGGIFSEGGNR